MAHVCEWPALTAANLIGSGIEVGSVVGEGIGVGVGVGLAEGEGVGVADGLCAKVGDGTDVVVLAVADAEEANGASVWVGVGGLGVRAGVNKGLGVLVARGWTGGAIVTVAENIGRGGAVW